MAKAIQDHWAIVAAAGLVLALIVRGYAGGKVPRQGRGARRTSRARGGRFVVHEHKASHLHYDFRLEVEGVLKSWAVPKGPSMNTAERRLAVRVPDHPVGYTGFQGVIPPGHDGAGPVVVWDRGIYRLTNDVSAATQLRAGRLAFELRGRKLKGRFAIARFGRGRGGKEWLLVKKGDAHADRTWKLPTELTRTRLAQLRQRAPACQTA